MTKLVRIEKNVHETLLHMKEKNNAKSINDVIESLITIAGEFYINKGRLNVTGKNFSIIYNNGEIVEIQIR